MKTKKLILKACQPFGTIYDARDFVSHLVPEVVVSWALAFVSNNDGIRVFTLQLTMRNEEFERLKVERQASRGHLPSLLLTMKIKKLF